MRTSDFHYHLPADLIAQRPAEPRSASRLLVLEGATGALSDRRFLDLPELLRPGDLLVFNDTRVIPARLYAYKDTGGRVELLVEQLLDTRRVLAQARASKPLRPGARLRLDQGFEAQVLGRDQGFLELQFSGEALAVLERIGHVPLPPYIARPDEAADRERYQTIFARRPGAVAAPTAGLHFDDPLLRRLQAMGVETAWVTLHVGAGTFQPLRAEEIEAHRMHAEHLEVGEAACAAIAATRARGARVVAVGTTVVRALETAARGGAVAPFRGETDIFIHPGHRFRAVDAMVTNFHLPESTLLMLVCAFAGTEAVLAAYRHAVEERYRFFSYGDAMFLTPAPAARAADPAGS